MGKGNAWSADLVLDGPSLGSENAIESAILSQTKCDRHAVHNDLLIPSCSCENVLMFTRPVEMRLSLSAFFSPAVAT